MSGPRQCRPRLPDPLEPRGLPQQNLPVARAAAKQARGVVLLGGNVFDWLPAFLDPPAARIIAGTAAGAIALGLVALAIAMFTYARVLRWAKTGGRIIGSQPGFELIQRFQTEQPRNERVAKIAYEFQVKGKTWRSGSILDTGHPGEDEVERLLAKYPKGAAVIVHYNPRDPGQSALEIAHPPPDLAMGCLAASAIVVVFAAIGIWLTGPGIDQVARLFPDALLPVMIPTAILGTVFLFGFFHGLRRAAALHRWPQVTGRIVQSRVHQFQVRRDKPKRTMRGTQLMTTSYMPVVEYAYSVVGRQFTSRSIWADTEVSGSQAYARGIAARYPVGANVTVRYDPDKPSRSALEIGGRGHWFLLLGAAVAFAIAAAASGLVF
jgi:hypothetical protein